jgi:hypothetical protein
LAARVGEEVARVAIRQKRERLRALREHVNVKVL